MARIDWIIFIVYLIFVFVVGVLVSKKAGKGIESYFVAGRNSPWWWLGISIIATTFAADTPLAITGLTANDGIAGNWFWWSWAATYITVAIFFAKRWRKSHVLTDVEFIELRYDGKQAAFLRGFKAFFFGVVINCFILGWVITAMTKITEPFIVWQTMAPTIYNGFQAFYPSFLLFNGDINTTITILLVLIIVVVYSTLGGIRGVILTDLFQFAIAMITAILFAVYAVNYVGGLQGLFSKMETLYGAEQTKNYLEFIPSFDNPLIPFQVFLIYLLVVWWVRYDSDGTGYIAQRINTAKTPEDAKKGTLLFAVGFLVLRTWPWILVALVTLVVFPMDNPAQFHEIGSYLTEGREIGYPVLMKLILPVGLLGLTFTSLMAAFMSTVDTHLNWGASYLLNDIYKRFINPKATEKVLIKWSRLLVVIISILAVIVSSQMDSISGAWKFLINAASGLGIAQLLRWLWWRANAYTEITAIITSFLLTFLLHFASIEEFATYELVIITYFSLFISMYVTYLTPAVKHETLENFANKVQPFGFWKGYPQKLSLSNNTVQLIYQWLLAMTGSFTALFATGKFLLLQTTPAIILSIISIVCFLVLFKLLAKESEVNSL